nr:hypothetical protein [Trichoderma harzianum]
MHALGPRIVFRQPPNVISPHTFFIYGHDGLRLWRKVALLAFRFVSFHLTSTHLSVCAVHPSVL